MWKFKDDVKPQGSSDGFWYNIANGYINVEEVLASEDQMDRVFKALETLQSFEEAMKNEGLIIEF